MRMFIGVMAMCVIAGCGPSEEEKRKAWITMCLDQQFTVGQCGLLYSIAKDASDDAATSMAMSSAAIGFSAATSGGSGR